MGVRFKFIAGGSRRSTSFTDTMNRASGGMGPNWLQGVQVNVGGVPAVALASAAIAASVVDGLQCMKISTFAEGVGNVQSPTYIVPTQPIGLLNRSQFSQWQVRRFTKPGAGNDVSGGPSVMIVANGLNSNGSDYRLIMNSTVAQDATLVRFNGTVQTVISGIGEFTFTDLDTLRLSAVINPSNVTLQVLKNNIVQNTFVDAAAGRLTTGMPGFACNSFNNASGNYVAEFRNFLCGPPA